MQILLENGMVLEIMVDQYSIEIANDPLLIDNFNDMMGPGLFMLGRMGFTTKKHLFAHTDIQSDMLEDEWFLYDDKRKMYYSYVKEQFLLKSKMSALISLVGHKTKELYRSLYNDHSPVIFVLILNKG